ncbi:MULTISPECIES: hypothetical protein [unclassified Domibacillus]|uniref:hypothetical protein n=1 Tax=unclassified Domibacillus TaxID=2632383 RepID=UPI001F5AD628|nr:MULTISPECIES: hypothetical protein [unclassified Domibacillus]MCI2253910.1 hypothetical protein [Domibacillus sp. PGB-M46]
MEMKEDIQFIRDIMVDKIEELNDVIEMGGTLSPKVELTFAIGLQSLLSQSIQKGDKAGRNNPPPAKKSEYETLSSIANK